MKIAALIFMIALSATASANSYRCGNSLVSVGDSLYEVQDLCGPSDGVYRWTESVASGSFSRQGGDYQSRSDQMERHTYSEYGKFDVYMIFRNGNLEKIVQGRR